MLLLATSHSGVTLNTLLRLSVLFRFMYHGFYFFGNIV